MIIKPQPLAQDNEDIQPEGPSLPYSLRNIKQQFSDGVAIVASQIDDGLQQLQTLYNGLRPRDLGCRWYEQKYVWGFTPQICTLDQSIEDDGAKTQPCIPFVSIKNAGLGYIGDTPAKNVWRLRNTFNPYLLVPTTPNRRSPNTYVWTNVVHFPYATTLSAISLMMTTDPLGYYRNPWVYGNNPPDGQAPDTPLNDFYIDLSVDNPWAKGNSRWLSETEMQRRWFNADNVQFCPQPGFVDTADDLETPIFKHYEQGDRILGVSIDIRNQHLAIAAGSVLRIAFSIPDYAPNIENPRTTGWNFDNSYRYRLPWTNQSYSMTLTTLEALR